MRKIKFNRRTGSIVAFVVSSIAMMSGILMTGLKSTTYQNIFINQAAHSYPFFDKDKNGNLQVHGLFNVEHESMENLILGVLSNDGNRFIARNGDHDKYKKSGDALAPIEDVLKKFTGCPKEIKHNDCLNVNVAIIPVDNKLPFKSSFKEEIQHALNAILKDEKIDKSKLNHKSSNIVGWKTDPVDNIKIENIKNVENLYAYLGLNDTKKANAYDKVKETIEDTFAFNDKIGAVNIFAANKYVRRSILDEFIKYAENKKLANSNNEKNVGEASNQAEDVNEENQNSKAMTYAFEFDNNGTLKDSAQNVKMLDLLMKYSSKFSSDKKSNKKLLLKSDKSDQEKRSVNDFFSESECIAIDMDIIDDKYAFFHKKFEGAVKELL